MFLLKFFGFIFNRSNGSGPSFAGFLFTTSITTSTAFSGVFSALFFPPIPSAPTMALTLKDSLVRDYTGVWVRGNLRVGITLDDRGPIRDCGFSRTSGRSGSSSVHQCGTTTNRRKLNWVTHGTP